MKIDKDAAFFRQIFLFQDLEDREIEQVLRPHQPPGISPPAASSSGKASRETPCTSW